jgi:putative endonuclease
MSANDNRRTSSATSRIDLGTVAENQALNWLEGRGLVFVARNFRCRLGEIDLIMRDRNVLVFVEVRYRKGGNLLNASQSVSPAKQRKVIRAASWYLCLHQDYQDHTVRFDVVAIDGPPGPETGLQWIRDAFRPGA